MQQQKSKSGTKATDSSTKFKQKANAKSSFQNTGTTFSKVLDDYTENLKKSKSQIFDSFDGIAKFWNGYIDASLEIQSSVAKAMNMDNDYSKSVHAYSKTLVKGAVELEKLITEIAIDATGQVAESLKRVAEDK